MKTHKHGSIQTSLYFTLVFLLYLGSWLRTDAVWGATSLSTGIHLDLFQEEHSNGNELTFPLRMTYEHEAWVLRVDTSYSRARVQPDEAADIELASLTDTHLACAYMLLDFPIGIRLGLDLSFPTGKARLDQDEQGGEIGEQSDLFEVDEFGQGWNIGANLGLIKEFGAISLLTNVTYIFNGEFDPTSYIPDDNLDPGDQILFLGLLNWQQSARFNLETFASYSYFFKDALNGVQDFQEGAKWAFGSNLHINRSPLNVLISLQGSWQSRDVEWFDRELVVEKQNSNGYDLFGTLDLLYAYSPSLSFRVVTDGRYYSRSDRLDELSRLPYRGERQRYALGGGVIYSLSEHVTCDTLVKYFVLKREVDINSPQDAETPFTPEDTTYRGVNLALQITYTF